MLDSIEIAKKKLGISDVSTCNGVDIIEQFASLRDAAREFDEVHSVKWKPLVKV